MNTEKTGADTRSNPPSANGFRLEYIDGEGETRNLVASWAAPFFVLVTDVDCGAPLLYHANDRAEAERFAQYGGRILNSDFTELDTERSARRDGATSANKAGAENGRPRILRGQKAIDWREAPESSSDSGVSR